jgi:hypothetical protein
MVYGNLSIFHSIMDFHLVGLVSYVCAWRGLSCCYLADWTVSKCAKHFKFMHHHFLHGLGRLTGSGIDALPRLCVFAYEYVVCLGRVISPSAKPHFLCQFHHMPLMNFVVSPPGCDWCVTDFWVWDAHEAQLRCPDEVDGDIWIWSTRRGLKPKFY